MKKHVKDRVELRVNTDKLENLIDDVMKMHFDRSPPFDKQNPFPDAIVPEDIEKGSKSHALFLFYGCMLDSRQRAETVYSGMRELAKQSKLPSLHTLSKKDIEKLIKKYFQNPETSRATETIYQNSRMLKKKYSGDPRIILDGFERPGANYEELVRTYEKLDEFVQFQNGVGKAALLVKNYVRFGIWPFNPCEIHVKADVHLNRIALANAIEFYSGCEEIPKSEVGYVRQERIVKVLTPAILEITKRKRISAVDLDDSLWLLGSKLCSLNRHSVCKSFCMVNCSIRPKIDETKSSLDPGKDSRLYHGIQRKGYDHKQLIFDFHS